MVINLGRRWSIVAVLALLMFLIFALLHSLETTGVQEQQPSITKLEDDQTFAALKEQLLGGAAGAEAEISEEQGAKPDGGAMVVPVVTEAKDAKETPTATRAEVKITQDAPKVPAATSTGLSKVIVMGKMKFEETEWVKELSDWQNAVYCVDLKEGEKCPTGYTTKMNRAKEAMPYLTYIIDHYTELPDIMAFVHAHRSGMPAAWHNDAPDHDAVIMLSQLRTETVLKRGYVNMRCIDEVGCPAEIQPFRDPPLKEKHTEHAFPYFYAQFFDASFDVMFDQIPTVATPCCGQFAVSREQVQKNPLALYKRIRTFLEETHYDDDTSGRVMEYMWHIIFGRDAVHCEELMKCWCEVYGRCAVDPSNKGGEGKKGPGSG